MKKIITASALALLIFACAASQDRENRTTEFVAAEFSSITRIHCINRTSITEETPSRLQVKVTQSGEKPLQVCYQISNYERCFDTRLNYTYTECREITPPYKHCHDNRFDGNEIWKIYHIGAGDTLMLGNDIFVAITGEGCFAAAKQ